MNQNSLSEFMILALIVLFSILIIMLFALIIQLKRNDCLRNEILELERMQSSLKIKISNMRTDIIFEKQLNKTLSEGLEVFTKKSKK